MLRRLAGAVRCAAVTALLVGGASAQASLIGSEVSCAIVPTPLWMCDAPTATVSDPASEFRLALNMNPYVDFFDVDFRSDSLVLTLLTSGLGMGANEVLTFGGLSAASSITGLSTLGTTGFTLADLGFADGTLTLILTGSFWDAGSSATINFATSRVVPEPSSLALIGVALAAAGLVRRRPSVARKPASAA